MEKRRKLPLCSDLSIFFLLLFSSPSFISVASAEEIQGIFQHLIFEPLAAGKSGKTIPILDIEGKAAVRLENQSEKVTKTLAGIKVGTKMKLSGSRSSKGFKVSAIAVEVPARQSSNSRTSGIQFQEIQPGIRTVKMVTLATSQGGPTACTQEEMMSPFDPVTGWNATFFRDTSRGKISHDVTWLDPIVVPQGDCEMDSWLWLNEVRRVMALRGPPEEYHSLVMVAPPGSTCNWSGFTTLGVGNMAMQKLTIVMNAEFCKHRGTLAHELGHNLSWNHSAARPYGVDNSDLMGNSNYLPMNNAPRQAMMGNLKAANIQMITGPGAYRVYGLQDDVPEIRALRRPFQGDPLPVVDGETFSNLWVSYRTLNPRDSVELVDDFQFATQAHLWSNILQTRTMLMAWPTHDSGPSPTEYQMITVPEDITITQISHTAQSALICVKIGGVGDCTTEISPPREVSRVEQIDQPKLKLTAVLTDPSVPYVGSVSFKIDSQNAVTDNSEPFSICGEAGTDPCSALAMGPHILTVTPYSGPNGTGTAGKVFTKNFIVGSPPLPVTLTYFGAVAKPGSVLLTWRTSAESHFGHFEVEQSSDAKNWKRVGTVSPATSRGNGEKTYTSTVTSGLSLGLVYFRLKMVDADGSFVYSRIQGVTVTELKSVIEKPRPIRSPRSARPHLR